MVRNLRVILTTKETRAMQAKAPLKDDSKADARKELRRLVKEIEGDLMTAKLRKSFFCLDLLEQVLALYQVDSDVAGEVRKIQGTQLNELRQDLFAIFAGLGKTTSDEALGKRITRLLEKYISERPKRGRPKKIATSEG
jgi:hypothetical protein